MIKNKLRYVATVVVAVGGLALFGAGSAYAQPAFVNGGFETDSWVGDVPGVSPTGWDTVLSGDGDWPYGIHNDGDTTSENTPFGNQFVELCARDCDGEPPGGSISQTVSGFVIGAQYRLTFQHTPEHHTNADPPEDSIVNVSITGGTPASTDFSALPLGGYFTQWKLQSLVFTANATSLTFTFSGVYDDYDVNTESGIDEVSVAPLVASTQIPTMSIYGLVLMMIALLILATRRLHLSSKRR